MKREIKDYLNDIVDAMDKAISFISEMNYEDFVKDTKTVYAVVRALEIIGEAVKKISANIRKKYPQIPWQKMAGMRDKLIHEYFGVIYERVWETVKRDIPQVKPFSKALSIIELKEEEISKKQGKEYFPKLPTF